VDYPVNIQLGVGGQRYLDAVINQASRLEKVVQSINKTPLALNIGGRGAARDASGILSKQVNDIVREFVNGERKIGESVSAINQQLAGFEEFLGATFIRGSGDIKKQDVAVQNLANTWAEASQKLDAYERKLENLMRTSRGLPTLEQEAATQARIAGRLVTPGGTISPPSEGPMSRRQRSGVGAGRASFLENLALGAGFPLLFGGGPGTVGGSILGSFVGTGFGGQILGGAIGQALDQAIQKASQLGSALQRLDLQALEESGYRVNTALATQVNLLKKIGDARGAQLAIEEDILRKTGAIPGTVGGITNAVNVLGAAWSDFTAAVSTLLGIIGAPFAAALGTLINAVNLIIKGINVAFSSVGQVLKVAGELVVKFIAGDNAVRKMNDGLKENNQELEKARILFAEILATSNAEILFNRELINIEKRRTTGRNEADKLRNVQLDLETEKLRINTKYDNERYEINKKLTTDNKQLVDEQLRQNEVLRKQALDLAGIQSARTQAIISATEQERRDREAAQQLEQQRKELERIAKLRSQQLSDAQDNLVLSEADLSIAASATEEEKIRAEADKARIQRMITFRQLFSKSLSDQERAFLFATQLNIATKDQLLTEKQIDDAQKAQTRELYAQLGVIDILSTKTQNALAGAFSSFSNADYKLAFDIPPLLADGELSKELEKVRAELEKLVSPAQQVTTAAEGIGQAFSASFTEMVNGSISAQEALANFFQATANNFLNMAGQMIAKYIQMQLIGLAANFLPGAGLFKGAGPYQFGKGDTGVSGFTIPSILGKRANGGPVSVGGSYLVGERGPELFMPRTSGSIYPNEALGASSVQVGSVNITVQNTGENLSPAAQKQIANQVQGIVMSTLVNQKRSGGIL